MLQRVDQAASTGSESRNQGMGGKAGFDFKSLRPDLMPTIRKDFEKNGFVIFRNVFTQPEIEKFRQQCVKKGQLSYVEIDDFDSLILSPRILTIVRAVIGDEVVYYGDSTSRAKDEIGGLYSKWYARHFHADARAEDYDFTKPYPLVRAGLYLQDHDQFSGGLKVRPGSHLRACREQLGLKGSIKLALQRLDPRFIFRTGSSWNVDTRAGDVVIWNMRIHHSGYAVRVQGLPNVSLPPILENLIPEKLHHNYSADRSTIFLSYGAPSKHADNMIKNRWRNKDFKKFWTEETAKPGVVEKAKASGVELRVP